MSGRPSGFPECAGRCPGELACRWIGPVASGCRQGDVLFLAARAAAFGGGHGRLGRETRSRSGSWPGALTAGMLSFRARGQDPWPGCPAGVYHAAAVPPAPVRPVAWRQLVLFHLPRDLAAGAGVFPDPRDPQMAAFLDGFITEYATRHGWPQRLTSRVRSGIRLLLGLQDTPGAPVKASDTLLLIQAGLSARPVRDVLAEAGMLDDDRVPAIEACFTRTVTGLPAPMASELRTWFEVMTRGSTKPPRSRPRRPRTSRPSCAGRCPPCTPGPARATPRCGRSPASRCSPRSRPRAPPAPPPGRDCARSSPSSRPTG